ncbi:MAG: hypothetical protein ABI333_24610 [bacterium]
MRHWWPGPNPRFVLPVLVLSLGSGCIGWFQYEDATPTVTVGGLGPTDCPPDWTGTELPPALRAELETRLRVALDELGVQVESEIDRKNGGDADVVELISLSLQLTSPPATPTSQNTFGFLVDLRIYVESSRADTALPRRLLAHIDAIPAEAFLVPLVVEEGINLQSYLQEGLQVSIEAEPRSCLRDDLPFQAGYLVDVRPTS